MKQVFTLMLILSSLAQAELPPEYLHVRKLFASGSTPTASQLKINQYWRNCRYASGYSEIDGRPNYFKFTQFDGYFILSKFEDDAEFSFAYAAAPSSPRELYNYTTVNGRPDHWTVRVSQNGDLIMEESYGRFDGELMTWSKAFPEEKVLTYTICPANL